MRMTRGRPVRAWAWIAPWLIATGATAQTAPVPSAQTGRPWVTTAEQLVDLSAPELQALYQSAGLGTIPVGKVQGRALLAPGGRLARPLSRGARLAWQGKVFLPDESAAVNRFFGVRAVRAQVGWGESWLDGRPTLVLDYRETSWVYRNYRDEIREVSPGLYLGLMYDRTKPRTRPKMYFVLDARK